MFVQTLLLAAVSLPVMSTAASKAKMPVPPEIQYPNTPLPPPPRPSPSFPPAATETFNPVPLESPQAWFRNERLPAEFGAKRQDATIAWHAMIGFKREVLTCAVRLASDDIPLEAQTCNIVRQWGKFAPARDDAGKPVMAFYQGSTLWAGLRLRPPEAVVTPAVVTEVRPVAPLPVSTAPTTRVFPSKAELRSRHWLSSDDFPPAAMRRVEEGQVTFRVNIGTDGRVFACRIDQSASELLDTETCKIAIRRLRFYPALDAKGEQINDIYTTRVIWRIPRTPMVPVRFVKEGGEKVELTLRFGQRGKIVQCTAVSNFPETTGMGEEICAAYVRDISPSEAKRLAAKTDQNATTISARIAMSND